MKILVVEDDSLVAQTLQLLFSNYNYAVDVAADGEAGLEMAEAFAYDLILLDVGLPKLDGVSLCQYLRVHKCQSPILLLTGQGGGEQKAIALNAGADDYVVKPFDAEELVARVQALLRRGKMTSQPILTWGHLSLNPNSRKVAYGIQLLELTPKEYAILELFLRYPQTVFSARAILDHGWPATESPGEEAVRAHIKEIRQKFTAIGAPRDLIKTVYRVGYRLNPLYSSSLVGSSEEQMNLAQIAELRAVNEELRLTLEELQLAQEELTQQNEQLVSAQRLLELEQQRYHDLFELAPDAYLVTDLQGGIQAANQAASDLFQVQSQALIGKPLTVFVAQSDRRDFRLRLNTLNFGQNWEVQVKPKAASPVPVLITVTTIKDPHNQVTGLRWLLRDIQLRKEMEQQLQAAHDPLEQRVANRTLEPVSANQSLQQQQGQWQALFDHALDAMMIADDEGHYVDINPAACELFGVAREDLLGLSVANFADPAVDIAQTWQQFLQQGQMSGEFRLHRPDGTTRETEFNAIANFVPGRHLSILRDISDRKQLELSLQASEAKLSRILDSAIAAIINFRVFSNRDWEYDYFSNGCELLFGYTVQELMADKTLWLSQLFPDDREKVILPLYEQFFAGSSPVAEYRLYHKNGSIRWISTTYASQQIEPNCWQITAVNQDITERKQAEIALEQQLAREQLVTDIAQEIRQSLDLDSVLSRTVERVRELLAADRVIIFRFRPDWRGDVIMESVGAKWTPTLSTTISDPCFRDRYIEPYRQGRVAAMSDIDTADLEPCYVEFLQQFQVKANLVVPIMQDDKVLWGLLIAHQCAAPRPWQSAEIDLLLQLATHVGIAIQQSELYQRTQDELAERERMQTVLEESEERFRTLSESAPIGICQTNADGICLYTNTRWQEMSGLSAANCLGDGWLQAIHPADRAALTTAWEAYLQGGRDRLPEFRLLTPEGEIRWIAARVAAMRSASGEVLGYVSTDEDITERKQAEEALLASEQRLQTVLDYSPAAIYLIDPQTTYLLVNRRCADLLSTTPDTLIGKRLDEVWPAPIAARFIANNQQVLATRQLLQTEETVPHPDGSHSYLTVKFPLCDAEGVPYAVCGISTDITDKKRLEAQFHQAQRLESLGTLSSGIAHDLNNVLTPILTIAQLLRLKGLNLDTRSQEMLKVLEDSARRGADLVKQILTFTRGTEGKRTPVKVVDPLTEVASLVQKTFPKSITIRATLPARPPDLILADATQLHQVLMNLCVNARDAMPNGGTLSLAVETIEITEISAAMNLDAQVGRYVVITITDTGTGIPPEVHDRIFDPFFTTKPFGQGTGLGLSTVLGIVRSWGGFVEVESQTGAGSQFKIYLPALKTVTPLREQEAALPQGQGELILVVDDEEVILQSTREILETYHYQVLTATNGRDAIACYAQHQDHIHVVLMDMMMPGLDGPTTIRALQDMNPQVKVIATSGLAGQYHQSLQALGITTILTKPFTTADLLQSLV